MVPKRVTNSGLPPEKIIGVVGVAPWSTIKFCEALYHSIPAAKDWEYPRVIIDINTKIPSRGRHFELGEADFSPYISESLQALKAQGAGVAVVTCNTAHIYYDRWARDVGIPIPHIGDAVTAKLKVLGAKNVAIMGGKSLREHRFYEQLLEAEDLHPTTLDTRTAMPVESAISEVKMTGNICTTTLAALRGLLEKLSSESVDGLILGCTELAALQNTAAQYIEHVVESNQVLANAVLEIAMPSGTSGN